MLTLIVVTLIGEMNGTPGPDGFGVNLPSGFDAKAVADAIAPASDTAPRSLIGMKPWNGRFVAIVCTGGQNDQQAPTCASDRDSLVHIYLGVFSIDGKLIAKAADVKIQIDWSNSGLPRAPVSMADDDQAPLIPEEINKFDLADYTIAPGVKAFGLRGRWNNMYTGGGAQFESLSLFVVDGTSIAQIFGAPMAAHGVVEATNVLTITKNLTAGHYDLVMKNRANPTWSRTFRWSKGRGAYSPAG